MCKKCKYLVPALMACAMWACGDGAKERPSIPKPVAWPRVQVADSAYYAVEGAPVRLEANTAARVTVKGGEPFGADIVYTIYNTTVYVTVVQGLDNNGQMARALDGRRERISRNLGTSHASIAEIHNSHGFEGVTVTAGAASQTPVQMLAWNAERGMVVSATAFTTSEITAANLDSIAPVTHALLRDLRHMASQLK